MQHYYFTPDFILKLKSIWIRIIFKCHFFEKFKSRSFNFSRFSYFSWPSAGRLFGRYTLQRPLSSPRPPCLATAAPCFGHHQWGCSHNRPTHVRPLANTPPVSRTWTRMRTRTRMHADEQVKENPKKVCTAHGSPCSSHVLQRCLKILGQTMQFLCECT